MSEAITPPSRDLGLEHALEVSRATARSVERLTRQHYAVAGDMLDFMLAPWQPIDHAVDPRTLIDRQSAAADRLMAAARTRAGEYLEILSEFGTSPAVRGTTDGSPSVSDAASPDEAASVAIVLPDDSPKAADAKTRRARGTKVAAAKDTDAATATAGGKPARRARKRPTS